MDQLPVLPGPVVTSRQGRDRGRSFVVIRVEDEQFVMMADGLTRKLDHLKKKKVKHVKARPARMDLDAAWPSGHLLDSDIRKFLEEHGYGLERPLCKED
jgi:hypothetical protein